MAEFTYKGTYFVGPDRQIRLSADASQKISDYPIGKVFITGMMSEQRVVVDVNRLLTFEAGLHPTTTQDIANLLTAFLVARYSSNDIPATLTAYTKRYTKRMASIDAINDERIKVEYTIVNSPAVRGVMETRHLCTDLVLSSSEVHLGNAIVSVNGVVHHTVYNADVNELYVYDGYTSCRRKGRMEIAVLDFTDLGKLYTQNISGSDIKTISRKGMSYLTTTVSTQGKFPLLSIDGYLYLPDDKIFAITGPNSFRIDARSLQFADMYLNSPLTPFKRGVGYDPGGQTIPEDNNIAVLDQIRKFFSGYHEFAESNTAWTTAGQFKYSDLYREIQKLINQAIDTELFETEDYFMSILLSPRTKLFLVENDSINIRKYPCIYRQFVNQYDCLLDTPDTPRGMARYNTNMPVPFRIMSNRDHTRHHIHTGVFKITKDIHKDAVHPPCVPAPRVDIKDYELGAPLELIELYA